MAPLRHRQRPASNSPAFLEPEPAVAAEADGAAAAAAQLDDASAAVLLRERRPRRCCGLHDLRPFNLPQKQRLSVAMQCVIWLKRNAASQALLVLAHSLVAISQRWCSSCNKGSDKASEDSEHPQHFVIICSPRSGSTLLVEALDAHPQIVCRGEILNPLYEVYGDVRGRPWWRVKLHWLAMFTPPLLPRLQTLMCCGRCPCAATTMAIGAKLFHVHVAPGALNCGASAGKLLRALPCRRRPLLVLLYRRCMLSSYLSLCRAFETDSWFAHIDDQGVDGDASTRSSADRAQLCTTSCLPTPAGLVEYRSAELREWEDLLGTLAHSGWRRNDVMLLCYEDDIDSPSGWKNAREQLVTRLLPHSSTSSWVDRDDDETRAWLERENVSVVQRKVDPVAGKRREKLIAELSAVAARSGFVWRVEDYELRLPDMVATTLA